MKRNFKQVLVCVVALLATTSVYSQDQLVVYPAPKGAALNADFTVKVRRAGQAWQATPSYLVKVDEVKERAHEVQDASMAYFDFAGKVEVSVTFNQGPIETARIRPLSYQIEPQIKGNTLTFTLDRPRNLSVEVNGDIFHNLHLFANPVETYKPDPKDPNVIYFGPGIHKVEGQKLMIPSGKTVYVAGGAVVMGRLIAEKVENVKILGRGMVDHTIKGGIRIAYSRNVLVEGLVTAQCSTGGSSDVTIRNVKSISYYQWGDGMNVFASNNVLHDGVFIRSSDDCTTVYGTRMEYKGGCKNVTMKNSTLWADVAHPIFIGIHGDTKNPEVLEDLNYINIDILDHKERQLDYQGCMAINVGDNNLVRNVRFENIRVEDFRQGQLVNLRIFYNKKYCTAPGRGIEDVLFKDITYTGKNAELSIISGYSEERMVKNIRFENLRINGLLITDDMPSKPGWYKTGDMCRFFVGEFTEDITFKK